MDLILNMTTANDNDNADENTAGMGDNIQGAIDAFNKLMGKLGAESVNTARPKLGIAMVQAGFEGLFTEKEVADKYDIYLAGREKQQGKSLLAAGVEDGNGRKANVSKCMQLYRLGALPAIDGPKLIDKAVTLRSSMVGGDAKIEAPFDAMVKVARAQIAKPDEELTDEELAACIRKAEPKDKDEVAKLVAAYKAAYKLHEELQLPGTEAAVSAYGDALVEVGGEIPPMTKEEKKHAAFMAQAAKMGFTFAGGPTI